MVGFKRVFECNWVIVCIVLLGWNIIIKCCFFIEDKNKGFSVVRVIVLLILLLRNIFFDWFTNYYFLVIILFGIIDFKVL